jgi:ACS family pantothenate transporter-like MFS transporter
MNYLDRSNLTAAYVSGMKKDLAFEGNQFNQINTVFTVGYVMYLSQKIYPIGKHHFWLTFKSSGQVPSNISLQYVKPSIFFPSMMVVWACLTMITAAASQPGHIMAIRFFQGLAESSTFVGTHYILGSWYTERELGKRSGIFTASGLAGTMVSILTIFFVGFCAKPLICSLVGFCKLQSTPG